MTEQMNVLKKVLDRRINQFFVFLIFIAAVDFIMAFITNEQAWFWAGILYGIAAVLIKNFKSRVVGSLVLAVTIVVDLGDILKTGSILDMPLALPLTLVLYFFLIWGVLVLFDYAKYVKHTDNPQAALDGYKSRLEDRVALMLDSSESMVINGAFFVIFYLVPAIFFNRSLFWEVVFFGLGYMLLKDLRSRIVGVMFVSGIFIDALYIRKDQLLHVLGSTGILNSSMAKGFILMFVSGAVVQFFIALGGLFDYAKVFRPFEKERASAPVPENLSEG